MKLRGATPTSTPIPPEGDRQRVSFVTRERGFGETSGHLPQSREAELNDAAVYYEEARPKLGEAFSPRFSTSNSILSALGARRGEKRPAGVVKRFPYNVLYRVRDEHIPILAIAHQNATTVLLAWAPVRVGGIDILRRIKAGDEHREHTGNR